MSSLKDQVRDWHQGVLAVARKDWDCALCLFSDIREPPAKIYFNMGCVHLMTGNLEAALQAFDQAVTKDTCMAVGFFQRGVANFRLKRFKEAVSDFQTALAQLRGNATIDYTQLGLYFKLQAWEEAGVAVEEWTVHTLRSQLAGAHVRTELKIMTGDRPVLGTGGVGSAVPAAETEEIEVLYNIASAQCQAGLWAEAADTLVQAISKWPEGTQDILDSALDQVQKQVPLQLRQVPKGEVFQPPRQYLQHLEPIDFLGKAKVVASVIPGNHNSDGWPQQRSQVEEVGHRSPSSLGGHIRRALGNSLPTSGGPAAGPSEDSSGVRGAAEKDPESLVTVTVQCHFTVPLKAPRGADLSSLRTLLAQALPHQAQIGQVSYQAPGENFWIPIPTEESLQSVWRNEAVGPRGLQLRCRGAWGRPVLYQVVAQHKYSAQRPEDLDFRQGDIVDVLCEVDEAWLEGHLDGCIGIFPKCFVVPADACVEALPVLGPKPGDQH